MGKLRMDTGNKTIQVGTPRYSESVSLGSPGWSPGTDDVAFRISADCNMTITDDGSTAYTAVPVLKGEWYGTISGYNYQFSANQVLAVM